MNQNNKLIDTLAQQTLLMSRARDLLTHSAMFAGYMLASEDAREDGRPKMALDWIERLNAWIADMEKLAFAGRDRDVFK